MSFYFPKYYSGEIPDTYKEAVEREYLVREFLNEPLMYPNQTRVFSDGKIANAYLKAQEMLHRKHGIENLRLEVRHSPERLAVSVHCFADRWQSYYRYAFGIDLAGDVQSKSKEEEPKKKNGRSVQDLIAHYYAKKR